MNWTRCERGFTALRMPLAEHLPRRIPRRLLRAMKPMNESGPACLLPAERYTAPDGLRCPACKGAHRWHADRGDCGCHPSTTRLRGGRIPDFLGGDDAAGPIVWSWPDGLLQRVESWLDDLRAGASLPAEAWSALRDAGLADARPALTALGATAAYHHGEYARQAQADQFLPHDFLDSLAAPSRVLDVGCGAGQTLRRLHRFHPAQMVGIDADLDALALGCRWAEGDAPSLRFVRATGHVLPFDDARFSHVICRVTINYMHQRRALREMVRVLQPGGLLYLRVEGPGFDWRLLRAAPGLAAAGCRLRDALAGSILAATGWQAQPGASWAGGRAFATVRRLRRVLAGAGCTVVRCTPTARCGPLAVGFTVLAERAGAQARPGPSRA